MDAAVIVSSSSSQKPNTKMMMALFSSERATVGAPPHPYSASPHHHETGHGGHANHDEALTAVGDGGDDCEAKQEKKKRGRRKKACAAHSPPAIETKKRKKTEEEGRQRKMRRVKADGCDSDSGGDGGDSDDDNENIARDEDGRSVGVDSSSAAHSRRKEDCASCHHHNHNTAAELNRTRAVCGNASGIPPALYSATYKNEGGGQQPQRGFIQHPKGKYGQQHAPACAAAPKVRDLLRTGTIRGENLREMIEGTVREILASDKTERCLEQERRRNEAKELAIFSRTLREAVHNKECFRPNLVCIVAQVAYQCRKNRRAISLRQCGEETAERIIEECTNAISGLLVLHGGPRVARQIQNCGRYREFITSMLFLMRAGISFQGRQILPRLEILNYLLPLQVLLPPVFKIRAKSITEGENLMKMDMKGLSL